MATGVHAVGVSPAASSSTIHLHGQPSPSASRHAFDVAHEDMIIEEEDEPEEADRQHRSEGMQGMEVHDDEFVVEEDEEEPAPRPLKTRRVHRRVGLDRHNARSEAPASRFISTKERSFPCARCHQAYTRFEHLARHLVRMHLEPEEHQELTRRLTCIQCRGCFTRPDLLQAHCRTHHPDMIQLDWKALRDVYETYVDVAATRNKHELVATDTAHVSNKADDWISEPIAFIPFAHKRTRWTSYWRRPVSSEEAAPEEDHLSDREWEEDEPHEDSHRHNYSRSSVAQPAGADFLPAPPIEDSDEEFVFEEDGDDVEGSHANLSTRARLNASLGTPIVHRRAAWRTASAPPLYPLAATSSRRKQNAIPPRSKRSRLPEEPRITGTLDPPLQRRPEIVVHLGRLCSMARWLMTSQLTVVDSRTKRGMRFKTGDHVKLESLVNIFRQQTNLNEARLLFFHRGQMVDLQMTPAEVGITNNDMIWFDVDDRPRLALNGDVQVPRNPP